MLQGFDPKLARTPKSPVGAGIVLMTTDTALRFDTVSVPVVKLVVPTWVLPKVTLPVAPIAAFIPDPASVTNCGLLGASEGTVSVPLKSLVVTLNALAVKVTPTVHEVLGASAMPEHRSDEIAKFGPGPGPEFVATLIVPMWIVTADWFVAVTVVGAVVLPVTPPYTEPGKLIPNGITFSGDDTACVTMFDVLPLKKHAPGMYVAVIESLPTGNVEVVHCAWSELGLPSATPEQPDIGEAPLSKVTVPQVIGFELVSVTVAVKVTD